MPYDPETGEWIEENLDETWGQAGEGRPLAYHEQQAYRNSAEARGGQSLFDENMERQLTPSTDYGNEQASYTNPQEPVAPQQAGPRILNRNAQGGYTQQTDAPIPQAEFRPSQPGGTHGTLSPQAMQAMQAQRQAQMSPEERLAETEAQIARLTPSHAESLQMSRLSNADAAVQTQMANGVISPQAGMQARQFIGQQLQPLIVRRSQIPMYVARARYQQMQMQTAERAGIMQEIERFNALTAQQRLQTVQLPDGSTVSLIANRQGNLTVLNDPAANQQRTRTEGLQNDAVTAAARRADDDIDVARAETNRRGRDPALPPVEPEFISRIGTDPEFAAAMRRYGPLDTTNVSRMREMYERYLVDRRLGRSPPQPQPRQPGATAAPSNGQAPNAQPAAPVTPEARAQRMQELEALLIRVASPPRPATPPAPPAQPRRAWYEPDVTSPGS